MEFSIPTSDTKVLQVVLNPLDDQVSGIKKAASDVTTQQQLVARFTASVAVAVFSIAEAGIHVVLIAVKSPFTGIKVTIGLFTDKLDDVAPALSGAEWMAHAQKIYACIVLFVNSVLTGAYDPKGILIMARRYDLMPIGDRPKSDSGVAVAPSSTT